MEEKIKLYYSIEAYYGVTLNIWKVKNGDNREQFIKTLKEAIKESEWLQKNMDIGDTLDFLDTLSNNLNGDKLFENVINNYCYIDELSVKAYELDVKESFNKAVFKNHNSYNNSETISIFGKLTPYLKKNEDFKEWFLYNLEKKDKELFLTLTDTEESLKQLIAYKNQQIKENKLHYEFYKKQYLDYEKKIQQLEKELKELEEK